MADLKRSAKMKLHSLLLMGLLSLGILGCRTFEGDVAFQNDGEREIWVDSVSGFKREPPVGWLIPQADAFSMMNPMPMPEELVIRWSFTRHRADYSSRVSLRGLPVPKEDEAFYFRFTKMGQWEVSVKKWK